VAAGPVRYIGRTVIEREDSLSRTFAGPVLLRYVQLRIRMLQYLEHQQLLTGTRREDVLNRVFLLLRILYRDDPCRAVEYFKQAIPGSFVPRVSAANTWRYVSCYRLLGFAATERLRRIVVSNP
jgi:hypothetical protein